MAGLTKNYANALYELSQEGNTLERDLEQAILVRDILYDTEVTAFLTHPHISDSEKIQLFQNSFSDNISKNLMSFLRLMVIRSREKLIVAALTEYIEKINKHLGRSEAKIVSAKQLTEKQIESIRILLTKQIDRDIKITTTVDPDVIGGFYVLVDGRIFDGTVRSKLNNMKERLKRGSIEW